MDNEYRNEEFTLQSIIPEGTIAIRKSIDQIAYCVHDAALEVQRNFRDERKKHQEGSKRGRAWVHDVRIKATRNGVSIEWIHYTGKYGDTCFSEGIRLDGNNRVPARNFRKCSATEKAAIRTAEDRFEKLRQITSHLSKAAESLNSINQIKINSTTQGSFEDEHIETPEQCTTCDCQEPCEAYRYTSPYLPKYQL
ncbi:conjugative transfer protein MobI(A/C) [Pseudomonas sp. AN-1]|uniref:conjugative transfer protein MobI(A/C) n=1 Tax=Pseudomonas sp. AN-1 TaxID=3096605 RepID=UPI002A6AC6E3|nr:conjugative transfer protein MobI(A/C) [Pseudomonas sp. AN-1]WPP44224.1 conjugative transfer protein MobI(A/C) [Pseudomonas sp. AN-1]